MSLTTTPVCKFGEKAGDFNLPGTDGRFWSLPDCSGPNGMLLMFICNHCPYVQAINGKLVRDALDLRRLGIHCVAIMPNDTDEYPEDSMHNMRMVAKQQDYPFPYLLDATQEVAREYGAVCTPDFFGYNSMLELQYRGRMDECGARKDCGEVPRELYLAMRQIAETGRGPEQQNPSMGCSIKWRGAEIDS
jgi:peroxiredoxin